MSARVERGNWVALAGVIVYLLEFAVFIPAGVSLVTPPGQDVVSHYATRPANVAIVAGLLAVVLMGRVVFISGLRAILVAIPRVRPLADIALAAMAISVALEVGALGLAVGAARLAAAGGERAGILALDGGVAGMFVGVFPTFGASVVAASSAMLWSGLFRHWLVWLGIASGLAMMGSGVLDAVSIVRSEGQEEWGIGPLAWMGTVIWMLTTGIVLLRRWRAIGDGRPEPVRNASRMPAADSGEDISAGGR